MVADATGDPMAALYILRLWGHCQERKSDTFVMPTRGLKAQCKFPGDAEVFERALADAGFIERAGDTVVVCGWAEKNASLLAAWKNGDKGGRPKKTQLKPSENPRVTHGQPSANQDETQAKPIREEKRREEDTSLRSVTRASRRCPADFEVTPDLEQWAAVEAPRADLRRETDKLRDHTFRTAYTDWPAVWRNWMRKASDNAPRQGGPPGETSYQRAARERVAQFAPGVAAKPPGQQSEIIDLEVISVPAVARH